MKSFFESYPYSAVGLAEIFLIVLMIKWVKKEQRLPMVLSGILFLPFGFSEIGFIPEYWNPNYIFSFIIGPEDVLFGFANGCLVWFLATQTLRGNVRLSIQPSLLIRRYLISSVGGFTVGATCFLLDFKMMSSVLMATLAVGVTILIFYRKLWRLALSGLLGYSLFHTLISKIAFIFNPTFLLQWNTSSFWGRTFLGFPIGEIAWSASFGAVWPLIMGWLFETEIEGNMKEKPKKLSLALIVSKISSERWSRK